MEEKKKIIGTLALSFSIFCLAMAIGFWGLELNRWRIQLPEILKTVSDTSGQIVPVMEKVKAIEGLIPEIIQEVENVRKTVDNVVEETENTRKALPEILSDLDKISGQIDSTVKQLPDIIDPILTETEKTRELIPEILEEVRLTRNELPAMMDRADQIIARADEAGRKAGKGAMTGMIGGVISMPFDIFGGITKGVTGLFGSEVREAMNEDDMKFFREKMMDLAENGKEGDVATWKNRKTSNEGKITLLKKYKEIDRECRQIKIDLFIKEKDIQTETITGCKQPDGSWSAAE